MGITLKDWVLLLSGVVFGGCISYLIAKKVYIQSVLKISMLRQFSINDFEFGKTFQMSADGHKISNLHVFVLRIALIGPKSFSKKQIADNLKPVIQIDGLTIHNIQTKKNDSTMFDIPIGGKGTSKMILNINQIKQGGVAEFNIIGSFQAKKEPKEIYASFFPGLVDAKIETSGIIKKPWKKSRSEL